MSLRLCFLVGLVYCSLLGASATRQLTDSSLGKYGLYNSANSALGLGNILPGPSYVTVSPADDFSCDKAACDKTGGSLSTASVTYCDSHIPVTMCVCTEAPYNTSR